MRGMNRNTGRSIQDHEQQPDHLYQSVHDILTTLIGTRLCRRNYGSLNPNLIDQPCNEITQLKLMNSSATALIRFEPRIKVRQVLVSQFSERPGYWEVTIFGSIKTQIGSESVQQIHYLGAAA